LHPKAERRNVHFLARHFTELDLKELKARFDRAIMILRLSAARIWTTFFGLTSYSPGGLLAAIVSEGGFLRQDRRAHFYEPTTLTS